MDEFTHSLRKNVEAALGLTSPWEGDVNPLVVIGLTEAMLDLRLSEDQMYAAIHSYVRQLASQVHPDRRPPNVSPERQRQIIEAFNTLDDRQKFSVAWKEFQALKASDRHEVNILHQSLAVVRSQLQGFQSREVSLKDREVKLELAERGFAQREQEQALRIPGLQDEIERLQKLNSREEATASNYRNRYWDLYRYIAHLCVEHNGQVNVLDARWVIVMALVETKNKEDIFTKSGDPSEQFLNVARRLKIPGEVLAKVFGQRVSIGKKFHTLKPRKPEAKKDESRSRFVLQLGVIRVKNCVPKAVCGLSPKRITGRLLGSIPSSVMEVERHHLSHYVLDRDFIFKRLSPYLFPGGLLVSERFLVWCKRDSNKPNEPLLPDIQRQSDILILAAG